MADLHAKLETMLPLSGRLPIQCRNDVETMSRSVRSIARKGRLSPAISSDKIKNVLLTGATGLFGRFVLHELLTQAPDLQVRCVVRAENDQAARDRIRSAMEDADLWEDSYSPRIHVLVGDVGQRRFGFSEDTFESLAEDIDAVYHFAGDISLQSSYLDIRGTNTVSVLSVLELCLRKRLKHVIFASTMGVFPQYFFDFANEFQDAAIDDRTQPDLEMMKRMFPIGMLGYPWSKLVSEQVLDVARQVGIPLAIFRLPMTYSSSQGFTLPDNFGIRAIAAAAQCETLADGYTFRTGSETVDTLSKICVAVSLNPTRRWTTYHCCNPHLPTYDLVPADFGHYWPVVPYDAFKRACLAHGESSPLHGSWALLDHAHPYWFSRLKPRERLPVSDRAIKEDCPFPIEWAGSLTRLIRAGEWIKSRGNSWPYVTRPSRLDLDGLVRRAESCAVQVGVPFDTVMSPWMRESLERLVSALAARESGLLEDKIPSVVFTLSRLIRLNAVMAEERQRHDEIELANVAKPVFIVGMNRSGTTFLHRLLARDRRFWALRTYEMITPVLQNGNYVAVENSSDDPRRMSASEAFESSDAVKVMKGIHDFAYDEPEEDFPILDMGLKSWALAIRYHVPEYAGWLEACGSDDVYAHHRRTMQHFTWQRSQVEPGRERQWLLKMPFHLKELASLLETYPDAMFILTHRVPDEAMGSWCSLVERLRSVVMEPLPGDVTGNEQLAFMSGMLNGATRFRSEHRNLDRRWVDVAYRDLIRDPDAVIRKIYRRFDWELTDSALDAMGAWRLEQDERRRSETRHSYSLADYGLNSAKVEHAFGPYLEFASARGLLP